MTLETIVTTLVERHGWDRMKSNLTCLPKTPWPREWARAGRMDGYRGA
ncbi:MAG: hypothetical protein OJF47_003626 [Nitrospira sp.]|nr:MAG: hypothetical protein OJF47_003626 [Nitrospira sp.]